MIRGTQDHPSDDGLVEELLGGTVRDQRATTDHDEMRCGNRHFGEQVAGDKDRATVSGQALHQGSDPDDALRIETVDRLVEHQDVGIAEQGAGDSEAVRHPEREGTGRDSPWQAP
ncbi:hypothetical protein BH24ACT9_BH24ACT9_11040 [soil metagenome]